MPQAADNGVAEEPPRHEVDLNGEFHFKVDGKGRVALPGRRRPSPIAWLARAGTPWPWVSRWGGRVS